MASDVLAPLFSTLSIDGNQWDEIADDYLKVELINKAFESKWLTVFSELLSSITYQFSIEHQGRVKKLLHNYQRADDLTDDLLDLFEKLILLVLLFLASIVSPS